MADVFITRHLGIPDAELTFRFARSGGPGGQNVNKVASKVELRWSVFHSRALSVEQRRRLLDKLSNRLTSQGELIVVAQRTRDQGKNRQEAVAKLVQALRKALAPVKVRKPTRATRGAKERRLKAKRERAEVKSGRRRLDS